jgi:hypothetical protein
MRTMNGPPALAQQFIARRRRGAAGLEAVVEADRGLPTVQDTLSFEASISAIRSVNSVRAATSGTGTRWKRAGAGCVQRVA